MKFTSLSVILSVLIFTVTGEPQDPIILRLIMAIMSALMIAAVYCGCTQDTGRGAAIAAPIAIVLFATTMFDPDPSPLQALLAFIVCPIIAFIAIKQEIDHETHPLVEPKKQGSDQG